MAGRPIHILLVDDEASFLFSASMALRVAGYCVSVASEGAEALEKVRTFARSGRTVDLVVTDIQMKGMGGKELIGAVREEWPSLPVFVVTGYLDSDLGDTLAMDGCAGHLFKPFDPTEFLASIGNIVDRGSGPAPRE